MKRKPAAPPSAIVPVVTPTDVATLELLQERIGDLVELWLRNVSPSSAKSYRQAMHHYAEFLGLDIPGAALSLVRHYGQASVQAKAFRANMLERGLASGTINLRVWALRSFVRHCKEAGLVAWDLSIRGVRSTSYRDTRGPGREGVQKLLRAATNPRDKAMVWLMYGMALRREEVLSLDLQHVDGDRLMVLGKGSGGERRPLSIPRQVKKALEAWIAKRGDDPGPLFLSSHRASQEPHRLTPQGLAKVVAKLGAKAKLGHVHPHGFRHAAITRALETSGGNMRAVQEFSRHRDPRTIMKYDDNREDRGGQIAAQVADDAAEEDEET